jgi:hypothetical protein
VKRWLVLPIGLGVAVVAAYVLLMSPLPKGSGGGSSPAQAEIGDESREQLLEILREADAEDEAER